MLAGIIGVAALVVVALIFVNVRKSHAPLALLANQLQESKDHVANGRIACESEQDPKICLRQMVIAEAKKVGSADLCDTLEEPDASTCVEIVAYETRDREACRPLGKERRNSCEDAVTLRIAKEEKDVRLCDGVQDVTIQETCRSSITAEIVALGACEEYGVRPELCDALGRLQDAVDRGDLTYCETFDEEDARLDCLEAVGETSLDAETETVDTDRDGLDDAREITLGTNPNVPDTDSDGLPDGDEVNVYHSNPLIADTDGDGYSDGIEVQNGFDPNGSGSL